MSYLFELMEARRMAMTMTDTLTPKVGQTVVYKWHVGNGSAISPARVEERTGGVVDIRRRGGRTEIRVLGASCWMDVSRVVKVL